MYYYGLENIITIMLSVIGFVIVLAAQSFISSSYNKYKKVSNNKNISGSEVARIILDKNGLNDIHVVEVSGELTDHYDPTRKVVRLSSSIFHGNSIAAMAVAAHECGHAIQDKENYTFMRIRSSLVPVVNFVSYAGYFVTLFGLFIGVTGYLKVGIFMLLATILFQLVTLPVEFDASRRAKVQIDEVSLASNNELDAVKNMLFAAAMTYVASLVSSILNLLRLIIMLRDRND